MNLEQFIQYCESKPFVHYDFPFGEETMVFRVKNKIFAITSLNNDHFSVNLKCDPERAEELREKYEEVQPGYHMNKKHWNTVNFEGRLTRPLLKELVDHSYELVKKSLPKKDQF